MAELGLADPHQQGFEPQFGGAGRALPRPAAEPAAKAHQHGEGRGSCGDEQGQRPDERTPEVRLLLEEGGSDTSSRNPHLVSLLKEASEA